MSFELHDLMPADMPLERFKRLGPKALSDTELLAIVLRTGTKEALFFLYLIRFSTLIHSLMVWSVSCTMTGQSFYASVV